MKPGGGAVTHLFHDGEDGDLRSGRVLGEDAGTIIFVSVRAQPHDQDGGDLRSGRVLGQETGTIIFVSRRGRWRPSVRPGARSGDRHDQKWNWGIGLGHPLFRGGRCNRGVVPLPIRFTARKDGDLRSGCLLGQETTHPFHGGHRRHDQDGGDLRSGRVLGQETTHPFHGGHRRHDHICFTARKDGDLRSGRVLD